MEREEWEVELEKRKILQDNYVTEIRKDKFIEEIKSGLGEKILKEPNTLHKKKGFIHKLKKIFLGK